VGRAQSILRLYEPALTSQQASCDAIGWSECFEMSSSPALWKPCSASHTCTVRFTTFTVLHVFTPPPRRRDTLGAQIFPGLDVHFTTLVMHFRCPFVRDYILLHGMLDCSRATCKRVLTGCAPSWAFLARADTRCSVCFLINFILTAMSVNPALAHRILISCRLKRS